MKTMERVPDSLIGLFVALFFLSITVTGVFNFTDAIEMKAFDLRARMAAPGQRNPDIELVAITDNDLSELGSLPWPRSIVAQGIENLSIAGAKVIALSTLLTKPQESEGFKAVKDLKETYEASRLAQKGNGLTFYNNSLKAQVGLDLHNDIKLYKAFETAGNVVLPVYFETQVAGRDLQVPNFIARYSFKQIRGADRERAVSSLIRFSKLGYFLPSFAEVADGIGHVNFFPDEDGCLRNQIHVLGYLKNTYFPSFALAIAKLFKGVKDEDITVFLGKGIYLGAGPSSIKVPAVDFKMRTLINWSQGPDVVFHQTPFTKVFKNQIQTSLFKDKIVIIGLVATGIGDRFATPISGNMPGLEVVANSVANILDQRFYRRPQWIAIWEFAALVFFGLFITFVLPNLRIGTGTVITLTLLVGCVIAGTILFLSSNIWLKIAPSMLLLIIGYALLTSKRIFIRKRKKKKTRGEWDERDFRDQTEHLSGLTYSNGLEAVETTEDTHYGDIGVTPTGALTRRKLGQYKLLNEIGQGTIGVVYKGQDLKTRRTVAIKAVSLSKFDIDIVRDIRDRFFRVAEAVRLLIHPNIITIYGCGEDDGLVYIAMEYLEGQGLDNCTKKGHLLPMREALWIIGHVAYALDYAHTKNLVHQDIKPANIIRIRETGDVKVVDFGIVQTPSYLSPEQVSGKKIDGRSDIFSLGVVLFELLTGEKPFGGGDMITLMLKITKEKHISPRAINPGIPRVVEKIIDRALEKDVNKRYLKAGHMATHLKQVVLRIDEIRAKKKRVDSQSMG